MWLWFHDFISYVILAQSQEPTSRIDSDNQATTTSDTCINWEAKCEIISTSNPTKIRGELGLRTVRITVMAIYCMVVDGIWQTVYGPYIQYLYPLMVQYSAVPYRSRLYYGYGGL